MRIAFINTLFDLAKKDKRVVLITGDLGYSVFEEYIKKLPGQFLNAGVAEQNMTGLAAGMAIEGKVPFIYSIVPFVTMRNFEQIRNDICYQNLNVKIVGVGSGFSYGVYGHTHYGLEDVGILRTIPGITIIVPGDPAETELAIKEAYKINGPVYVRLGKAGEPVVHKKIFQFKVGKGIIVEEGKDITLIATGTMLFRGLEVAHFLREKGINSRVISMHTIKPLDREIILDSAKKTTAIFTLEEHSIIGGLGSAVSEVLVENRWNKVFKRFGSPDRFSKITGSQKFMREKNGLSLDTIVKEILKLMK